jgi:hypothetical protein
VTQQWLGMAASLSFRVSCDNCWCDFSGKSLTAAVSLVAATDSRDHMPSYMQARS